MKSNEMTQVVVMASDARRRWRKAGEELAKADPERFAKLLEIAERYVRIHADPLATRGK